MKMSCTANCARNAVAKGLCLMHYKPSTAAGTDIARQFGVAKTTVSSIRLGRTWSNL